MWVDPGAHPHSDKLHVIERYSRPDLGHLEKDVTVEDPGRAGEAWTFKSVADLAAGEEIREFICAENNRDVPHMVGKITMRRLKPFALIFAAVALFGFQKTDPWRPTDLLEPASCRGKTQG